MRRSFYFVLVSLWLVILAGCAVKPQPFSNEEHWQRAMEDKAHLYENQPPLNGPLTLDMAIARALTYNYDHRLAMLEGAFQSRELTVANLGMLPKLTAGAGYTFRSNESASRSISYFTRNQTLEPSISQERQRTIADLTFNWSALDFGISYFQAKQYADRYLIAEERRRRVINNIVKDVITAYWRVAVSDMMEPQVKAALRETELALSSYRAARQSGLEPMLESLEAEKRLLQITSGLKRVSADMAQARPQLATLINIPPSQPFAIVPPDMKKFSKPPVLPADIERLEDLGLYLRPDLREELYQERIDKTEVKKEIVRMIPGLSLTAGTNYDSNKFMYNNVWSEATARVSSNLLGLVANYHQYKAAKTQVEVAETRRRANMIAALVQIHLAHYQYALALEDYKDNQKLSNLERQIYNVVNNESQDGSISELEKVNRHTDMIAARLQELHSLTLVYDAWGNLYFSVGGDLVGNVPLEAPLEEKAALIQTDLNQWWSGKLPDRPTFTPPLEPQAAAAPQKFKARPTNKK